MARPSALVRVSPPLRFHLPAPRRHGEFQVAVDGGTTLVHVVESAGVPRTEIGELRVDGRPAGPRERVPGGVVVDVLPVPRPQRVAQPRFVVDVHLGALARWMRLLGLDVDYRNDATDADLVTRAAAGRRVLLTQDLGLLRRRALPAGAYVRGSDPDEQLRDVLDRFDPPLVPWSRCLVCNDLLEPVAQDQVAHLLREGTRRTYRHFSRCRGCGRPYWRGAHAERLQAVVAAATAGAGEHGAQSGRSSGRRGRRAVDHDQ